MAMRIVDVSGECRLAERIGGISSALDYFFWIIWVWLERKLWEL